MTASQAIGVLLNQATAITAIVSTRIYNGNRPVTSIVPCINYYEISGGVRRFGYENTSYSINARAATAETALTLARHIDELFGGLDGAGIYGYASSVSVFSISRAYTIQRQGLIPEPEDGIYNAPVDIHITFSRSAVS